MRGSRQLSIALLGAALASPALASAQTGVPPPGAREQPAQVGITEAQFAAQVTSLMEGSPPVRLGRAWVEVVAEVRQRLAALDRAAAAGAVASVTPGVEPLPPATVDEPEVLVDEPGAGELIADENEIVLRRWGALQLFAEPIVVQTRGVTYDQWETSVLPGLGLRFPIPIP